MENKFPHNKTPSELYADITPLLFLGGAIGENECFRQSGWLTRAEKACPLDWFLRHKTKSSLTSWQRMYLLQHLRGHNNLCLLHR